MRVKLLNDGGYFGLSAVKFPVEVEARTHDSSAFVRPNELLRVGGDPKVIHDFESDFVFEQGNEYEVIDNE